MKRNWDGLLGLQNLTSGLLNYLILTPVRDCTTTVYSDSLAGAKAVVMFIRIERGSSSPISRQIAEQIRAQCLAGVLKPGRCLPSVRHLASELAVNVNTIVRVYERLAAEGLVELRHGEGTFVLPPATPASSGVELKEQRGQFSREFEAHVRRGLLLGLTTAELRGMLTAAASEAKTMILKQMKSE